MPLIRYRTDEENINEIMVDGNITVSDFMDLVNRKSSEKITKSVFRGKILDDDDLIRNHITDPDHVLILLTKNSDLSKDVMDLEQELKENKKKKEVENTVSSSILSRLDGQLIRKGFKYTFTIYTTATSDSMLYGNKKEFFLSCNYSAVYNEIEALVSSFPQIDFDFDLHIFLPGGVPFNSGTLNDYYINPDSISFDNIYVIVINNQYKLYGIDKNIEDPCCCSDEKIKNILSPFCKSSIEGLTQIAAFLGYVYHGGLKSEQILISLAKITRFAPLVVNLYRLIEKRPLKVLNILAITAPLFTLFRSMLPSNIANENVFEYTLNFLSVFEVIKNTEYLKFLEINTEDVNELEEMRPFINYCLDTHQQEHVIVWTADTINPDFQSVILKPKFQTIENIFSTVTTFKPVAPLSLHYIFYPTFIQGNDEKSVMLFIKEVPDKENVVSIINPIEGKIEEIEIEKLAHQMNCDKKDELFSLIDPNQVDQIIFICFDESQSMKWRLEGRNPQKNEKSRAFLASEFLKALVKQSFALRVSSFYGLISFNSEVKIRQPLTAMSSHFLQSLKEISPYGNTLLFDAIKTAQEQICSLVKDKSGKSRFPNAQLRIIVITDGADNKSKTLPKDLVNELIQNEIVVDTVLLSLIEQSTCCCTISKLTGGLSFMPKNYEDGIKIFEQEAFLNIKIRHMNRIPYDKITSNLLEKEMNEFNDQYASYAPNQMIINAKSNVSLATPMYMLYISMQKRIKNYRITRALTELNIIARNPSSSYVVYSLYATPEEWRIFLKGPEKTPFNNKWLSMYMVIPSNYPYEPPRFRFITIPFHPNVSSEGTVIFNLNDRNYTSSMGIDSIIIGIRNLLAKPDKNYAINGKAMELYMNDINEYTNMQKKGETGCSDYQKYLQKTKIYEKIPSDVVVPDEDRSKSNLLSITKDVVNKATFIGGKINDQCLLDINDYEVIAELGSGSFANVYLIADKLTNFEYAAKVPKNIQNLDAKEIIDYVKEVNVVSIFNHAAIAKVYGYCLKDFDGNDKQVIIMENVPNGDLQHLIDLEKKSTVIKGWDETQKMIVLYGIASGMEYSVSYGIAHSDLKPENVLMTDQLYPKITDFDSARVESENFTQSFNMTGQEICSPLYTAPEIIKDEEQASKYAEKSDVYSLSMIMYQMFTLLTPFPKMGQYKLYRAVISGERPVIPKDLAYPLRSLIQECWNGNPENRPTFKQIVNLLTEEDFLSQLNIDQERFQKYVYFVKNYKDAFTKSQIIRPKSRADKKRKTTTQKNKVEIIAQLDGVNIINLNAYIKEEVLGAGTYSQVFRIKEKKTGNSFAAKVCNHEVSKEVNIMKELNHHSIIKFIGYSPIDFEKKSRPTIITEYSSHGSLQDIINNVSKYPEWNETKRIIAIYGIVAGMAHMHENSIIHNDLKPSNVLLDENFYPKIADFGLSQKINNSGDAIKKRDEVKGTPTYMAPEIWNDQIYSKASDVYSFGILLYELIFLKKAYNEMKHRKIALEVTSSNRPSFPMQKQNEFKPIIQRCWDQNPENRPTFKELLVELQSKSYITKNVDEKEFKKYVQFINKK